MPASVYLDSASGMPLHPAAREVLARASEQGYADPRRLHTPARNARLMLDNARAVVAGCLDVRPDEVTFTPSGTHAVHLGVLGLLAGNVRTSSSLVASAVEHSAVMHAGRWHEQRGGAFSLLPVSETARVLPTQAQDGVLALQAANHEVGTVQPDLPWDGPVFTDACALAGLLPLRHGWDAAALSAHKWGGPAGVGVLLVRKGARWRNPFPGDDRVDERATGMEDVAGALAAAAALQAVVADRDSEVPRLHALIDRIRTRVAQLPDTDLVGEPTERLPHVVTFSCLYVDGEALVSRLDRLGFSVASGSACTSSALEPSHVLAAMGALTHGNVRVSVSRDTTEADVDAFLTELPGVVADLRAELGTP